jgi:hypothetical protein
LPAIDAACTAEEMAACVLVVGLKESILEAFPPMSVCLQFLT